MRDGLSLLDQAIASCEGTIDEAALVSLFGLVRSELYLELNQAIVDADPAAALRLVDQMAEAGQDLTVFSRGLLANFRNLLVLKVDPSLSTSVDLTPEQITQLQPMLDSFGEQDLLAMLDRAGVHHDRIHRSTQPRILLEACVVELASWERRVLLSDLVQRLRSLVASGGVPAGGGGGARASRPAPAASRPAAGNNPTAAAPTPTPSARPAAAGTVQNWTGFVDTIMKKFPAQGSCLMTGLPELDLAAGRLTVAFEPENSFMMKNLEKGRKDIESHLADYFGKPLHLVLQMVANGSGPSEEQQEAIRREVAPTDKETLALECTDDPTLNRLVDMVQGQPLPDSEREKWQRPTAPKEDPEQG